MSSCPKPPIVKHELSSPYLNTTCVLKIIPLLHV